MTIVDTDPAAQPSLEKRLEQAKASLQNGDIKQAAQMLDQLLSISSTHRDGLYYMAVCLRKLGEYSTAEEVLRQLKIAHPRYGRAFQEQGYCFLEQAKNVDAIQSFEAAVALNAALLGSWKILLAYYEKQGNVEQAELAYQRVRWLSSLPEPLRAVTSLINENRLFVAEQICRRFLTEHPKHAEAMRLLASVGSQLQILDDAEFLLESCVEFEPTFNGARLDYVMVLHKRQKFQKSLEQAQHLYKIDSNNVNYKVALAAQYEAVGNFSEALSIYDSVVQIHPNLHGVYSARGHALKTVGQTNDAIASYQKAYQITPSFGDAYWSLANLKTYTFSDDELTGMRGQLELDGIATEDKFHLCFALGKALEDREMFAESFAYYDQGNRLKLETTTYSSEQMESQVEEQKRLFDAGFFESRRGSGSSSNAPIFVVGLPRAGSTLLEQILASHSQVDGTRELANIIGLANQLNRGRRKNGEPYPSILASLKPEQLKKLGDDFIEDTLFHRQGGVYFIDKMPNNFRHIPLIKLILPNAKIIDARREPMACCFSGFKQLFSEGQEFSYGLDNIGRYYRAYVDVMSHWDTVLPGQILRVQHEDVVDDLEAQVRRLLDFCDLPFEQQCLDFHQTERAVRTPSSEQVRQPIYQSGLSQWKNYDEFLQPLKEALGATATSYR